MKFPYAMHKIIIGNIIYIKLQENWGSILLFVYKYWRFSLLISRLSGNLFIFPRFCNSRLGLTTITITLLINLASMYWPNDEYILIIFTLGFRGSLEVEGERDQWQWDWFERDVRKYPDIYWRCQSWLELLLRQREEWGAADIARNQPQVRQQLTKTPILRSTEKTPEVRISDITFHTTSKHM